MNLVWPLFRRNMGSCVKPFAIILAVMCMYTGIIIYMFDPALAEILNRYQEALPDMMAAVGMTGVASSLLEWIQIYLYGFIMLLFPLIFIIILNHKLVARYIDDGSMAYLLASPHSRRRIILTQMVSAVLYVVLLMAAITGIGIACCEAMFPGELDIGRYLLLNAGTCLLQLTVTGLVFAAACFAGDNRVYYTVGAGIPIGFFLLYMLSNLGGKLENLTYVTLYSLLPTDRIIAGEGSVWPFMTALAGLAVLLFGAGAVRFTRRDLSL